MLCVISVCVQMMAEHRSASALEASAREQSVSASPSTPTSPGGVTLGGSGGGVEGDVLSKCRSKILKILELLVEKMTEDIILQLLEVSDVFQQWSCRIKGTIHSCCVIW